MIEVKLMDGLAYLETITNDSIDLILTDPPYIISKDSGMNILKKAIDEKIDITKNEEEWRIYSQDKKYTKREKENFLLYGTIYGKKYAVKTSFGDWDNDFTLDILDKFISQFYQKLRNGGTLILFFDLWKITLLKDILEKYNFKQIRMIEWIKTNPQPRNSKTNYLTNAREIALVAVKKGKPTFNSSYDVGIYHYPIQGKYRNHPTQKNLSLFEELIKKHSNENDVVLDSFLGSGTTLRACINTGRNFKGCEISSVYFENIKLIDGVQERI